MFQRSRHIAVTVPANQVAAAIEHYKTLFGADEVIEEGNSTGIKGKNFTIWVEGPGENPDPVLQEWVTEDREAAKERVLRSGATITGESEYGFYVRDQFGLAFHMFVEPESAAE